MSMLILTKNWQRFGKFSLKKLAVALREIRATPRENDMLWRIFIVSVVFSLCVAFVYKACHK